jgi:L-alanine-DL-glutamate epimerase-like enolase superfamily enzyme
LAAAALAPAGVTIGASITQAAAKTPDDRQALREDLEKARLSPVLKRALFPEPVIIESLELLHDGNVYYVRVRSKDGAEGFAMTNRRLAPLAKPIMVKRSLPFMKGKDARDLDALVEGVFSRGLNYKHLGITFWTAVSWVEFAILDLLGNVAGLPVSALIGDRTLDRTQIYYASGNRGNAPEAEVAVLQGLVAKSGAKAIKFKLGDRLDYNDASNARDEALIPLARRALGDETALFVDANSSFDAPRAIETGRMLSAHGYDFFEEPVRFDDFDGTKAVADAVDIPIAGGEQETSHFRYRWLIENDAVQIVQPDVLLGGGYIRATRVARMAAAAGKPIVPHISGWGLGFLHILHFASATPNIGPYQEFKGDKDGIPYEVIGAGAPLKVADGAVDIPSGPGLGIRFDPDYVKALKPVDA